jgi:hypothetical protein
MTILEWEQSGDSYYRDGLRIHRLDAPDVAWVLDADVLPVGLWHRDLGERYRTLRLARAAAVHMEVVRLRRMKRTRHLVLATALLFASVWFYRVMERPDQLYRIEWFAFAVFAMVLALSEALSAFLMTIDDGWDYRYEIPRITFLDRAISAVILRYPTKSDATNTVDHARVRVLETPAAHQERGIP